MFDTHIPQTGSEIKENFYNKRNNLFERTNSTTEIIENTHENKISLQQYLVNQIKLQFDSKHVALGIAFIDYLHPSGWIVSSLESISSELQIDLSLCKNYFRKTPNLGAIRDIRYITI